jgi:hypothetical protein
VAAVKVRRYADYPEDLDEPDNAVYVSIHYQTPAGNEGAWARWTDGPDLSEALAAASNHVRAFKRCMSIFAGDASPRYWPPKGGLPHG